MNITLLYNPKGKKIEVDAKQIIAHRISYMYFTLVEILVLWIALQNKNCTIDDVGSVEN